MSRISSTLSLALLAFLSTSSAAPVTKSDGGFPNIVSSTFLQLPSPQQTQAASNQIIPLVAETSPTQISLGNVIEFVGNPTQGNNAECVYTGPTGDHRVSDAAIASDSIRCVIPDDKGLQGQTAIQINIEGSSTILAGPTRFTIFEAPFGDSSPATGTIDSVNITPLKALTPVTQIALGELITFSGNPTNGNNAECVLTGPTGDHRVVDAAIASDSIRCVIPDDAGLQGQTAIQINIEGSATILAGPTTFTIFEKAFKRDFVSGIANGLATSTFLQLPSPVQTAAPSVDILPLEALTPVTQIALGELITFSGNPTNGNNAECVLTGPTGDHRVVDAAIASDSIRCVIPDDAGLQGQTAIQINIEGSATILAGPTVFTIFAKAF